MNSISIWAIALALIVPMLASADPRSWYECEDDNCYNFATTLKTGTFAQPGRASGRKYETKTCTDANGKLGVVQAAINDGLTFVEAKRGCADDEFRVALVIAPGWDFHWYRWIPEARHWVHKMGGSDPSSLDYSEREVLNVELADRGDYTDFCGYFCVNPSKIKVQ